MALHRVAQQSLLDRGVWRELRGEGGGGGGGNSASPIDPIGQGSRDLGGAQEEVFSTLQTWQEDRSTAGNAEVLLIIAIIYANEGNYVEALKACHAGQSLEL